MKTLLATLALLLTMSGQGFARTLSVPDPADYYPRAKRFIGKKITKIIFLDERAVPDLVRQEIMSVYMKDFEPRLLRGVLRWLHENQADTRIEFYLESTSSDTLTLYVTYKERKKIAKIVFDGNVAVTSASLEAKLDLKAGADFDPARTAESARKLVVYYNQQGYLNATVEYHFGENDNLVFTISEGPPTFVDSVAITELKSIGDKRLRRYYEDQLQHAFGLNAGEKVDRERVQSGLQNVKDWLRDHDFLTAKDPLVTYSIAENGRVRIKLNIIYGPRIRFGFRGNKRFSYRELIDFVGEVKEVSAGGDYLDAIRRRITEAYKEIGLANMTINTLVHEDAERGIRYVSLIITEGQKVPITNLKIEGIYSMPEDEAMQKFKEFAPRLVQRDFFQESGLNKAAAALADYLKSRGYLSAKLEFSKFEFSKDRKKVEVTLLFNEGIQTLVQSIRVNGVKSIKHEEVAEMLGVKEGDPFDIFKFEQGLTKLKEKYQEIGNLDARIENEDSNTIVSYTKDDSGASIEVDVDEGPLIRVGDILVRGNQQTHARVILRELPVISGDVLTKPLLNESEENLRKLNLFSSVIVRPIDHPGDETKKDILILVEESVPGTIEVAPGFRNDLGVRFEAGAEYRNLGGWGRSVSANAVVNHRFENFHFFEYDVNFGFREPYLANWPVVFTTSLDFLQHQFSKFDAYISKLTNSVRRDLTKNLSVFLEYSYEQDNIQNAQLPYTKDDEHRSLIGAFTPGFIIDTRNDTFNPRSGFYSVNRYEVASRFFGSEQDIGYYRSTTANDAYISIYDDLVLALAATVGWERSNIAGRQIPVFKLFRLGGIGSIRGYDDDSIQVETYKNISGTLGLVNYRSELRIPVSGAFGTALFVDAGNLMVDRFTPFILRSSAGVGLRYTTPVGPVSLDVAWKLQSDAKVGDTIVQPGNRYKIHFAIGAF